MARRWLTELRFTRILAGLVLANLTAMVVLFWRRFTARERRYFVAASVFLCSTACVVSIG